MTIAEGAQFGPYRLIEKIGSGGMGEVYRALDTRLEREVALKVVSASYLSSEVGSGSPSPAATPHSGHLSHERFLREARSAATLNHPNVCSIHDTGEQDGQPYLVMELLRGVTLKKYLADAGGHGLPANEVISFSLVTEFFLGEPGEMQSQNTARFDGSFAFRHITRRLWGNESCN